MAASGKDFGDTSTMFHLESLESGNLIEIWFKVIETKKRRNFAKLCETFEVGEMAKKHGETSMRSTRRRMPFRPPRLLWSRSAGSRGRWMGSWPWSETRDLDFRKFSDSKISEFENDLRITFSRIILFYNLRIWFLYVIPSFSLSLYLSLLSFFRFFRFFRGAWYSRHRPRLWLWFISEASCAV